jgi:hypothetical protein
MHDAHPHLLNLPFLTQYGEFALHRCAAAGRLEIVRYLVETMGVDVDLADQQGRRAQDVVCKGFLANKALKAPILELFEELRRRTTVNAAEECWREQTELNGDTPHIHSHDSTHEQAHIMQPKALLTGVEVKQTREGHTQVELPCAHIRAHAFVRVSASDKGEV